MQEELKQCKVLPDGTLGDLLIIIDLQNVYLQGQPWECPGIMEAWKNVETLLQNNAADNVIFTRFLPPREPVGTWMDYLKEYKEINDNPWMSEMIEPCKPYLEKYSLYDKERYSSFSNEMVKTLASRAKRVVLAGVVAECCVLFTALQAMDAGNKVVYLKDACAGVSAEYENMVEKLISYYQPMHGMVQTCEEYQQDRI